MYQHRRATHGGHLAGVASPSQLDWQKAPGPILCSHAIFLLESKSKPGFHSYQASILRHGPDGLMVLAGLCLSGA